MHAWLMGVLTCACLPPATSPHLTRPASQSLLLSQPTLLPFLAHTPRPHLKSSPFAPPCQANHMEEDMEEDMHTNSCMHTHTHTHTRIHMQAHTHAHTPSNIYKAGKHTQHRSRTHLVGLIHQPSQLVMPLAQHIQLVLPRLLTHISSGCLWRVCAWKGQMARQVSMSHSGSESSAPCHQRHQPNSNH